MNKTNFVISRAGSSSIAELLNCNKPMISIPLPTSADNHQYKNAEFYSKNGYGYFLEEQDIKATMKDGVLTLTLPKKHKIQMDLKRRIEIKTA